MRVLILFAILGLAGPAWSQFAGPAILSRGEAPAAMALPNVAFRPFVELSAVYDTGLTDARLSDTGGLARGASEGASISAGISGTKSWKLTSLGIDYQGSYTDYRYQTTPQSFSQSLLLGIKQRVTRHLLLEFRESAGMFTRDFGLAGLSQTVPFDPGSMATPTTDYFDNRTYFSTTLARATIQRSARLSFSWGGGYFTNLRSSKSLYSMTGETANGDVQYRASRTVTVGALYRYDRYAFKRDSGDSNIHTFAGSYSMRPSRRLEFSGQAGIAHIESKFPLAQQVDPVIAELLGIVKTVQIVHTIKNRPYAEARLSRVFSSGVVYVSGGTGVTPGNGVFLTSYTTRVMAGYQYTGLRRWSMGVQGGDSWAEATGNASGNYAGATGSLSISRSLWGSAHLRGSFAIRQYQSGDFSRYNRTIYNAMIGIGFTPGSVPLRVR